MADPTETTVIDSEAVLQLIQPAAAGPAEVSSAAGTVRQFGISELIAAHKYLATLASSTAMRTTSGLRFSRLVPGGAVQRDRIATFTSDYLGAMVPNFGGNYPTYPGA